MYFCSVLQQQKNLEGYVGFASLPNQVYRKSVKRGFEFTLMVVGKNTGCCVCPCFIWIISLYLLRLAFFFLHCGLFLRARERLCVCVYACSHIYSPGTCPQLCSVNCEVREEGSIALLLFELILMSDADTVSQNRNIWDGFIKSCTQRI